MPFSNISLKQSLSKSSLQFRDARKSFVTTSTWSRLILKAFRRADSNELLQSENEDVYALVSHKILDWFSRFESVLLKKSFDVSENKSLQDNDVDYETRKIVFRHLKKKIRVFLF